MLCVGSDYAYMNICNLYADFNRFIPYILIGPC